MISEIGPAAICPRERVIEPYCARVREVRRAYFPGYLFAHEEIREPLPWYRLTRQKGIRNFMLEVGRLERADLEMLEAILDPDGFVKRLSGMRAGDAVEVVSHPLYAGLRGAFVRHLNSRDRVEIMLRAVTPIRVELPAKDVIRARAEVEPEMAYA